MIELLKKVLAWLIRLPPVSKRERTLLMRMMHPGLRPEYDISYLIYQLLKWGVYLGAVCSILVLIDLDILHLELLGKSALFKQDNLYYCDAVRRVTNCFLLPLALIFYLRIRLFYDLEKTPIPVFMRKSFVEGGRKEVMRGGIITILIIIVMTFFGGYGVKRLIVHFHGQDSLGFIMAIQGAFILVFAYVACLIPYSLLLIEKTQRYFDQMTRDMALMGKSIWGD